ncbi:hypothetical protein L596_014532 [Steinernema carpocapsae]|uniref:FLYWCH-type domain-containing protein n=1 Tax=Steinernema carpocapsae TaxID=34508 RepID=A0A4U5NCZ8_STECR|nr:hypothetical protein L596_014532 [Steinernema carpocapsae]
MVEFKRYDPRKPHVITSFKGNQKLIFEGYRYNIHHIVPNKNLKTWRCVCAKKLTTCRSWCKGRAETWENDIHAISKGDHNHTAEHDIAELEYFKSQLIIAAVNYPDINLNDLIETAGRYMTEGVHFSSRESLKKSLTVARKSAENGEFRIRQYKSAEYKNGKPKPKKEAKKDWEDRTMCSLLSLAKGCVKDDLIDPTGIYPSASNPPTNLTEPRPVPRTTNQISRLRLLITSSYWLSPPQAASRRTSLVSLYCNRVRDTERRRLRRLLCSSRLLLMLTISSTSTSSLHHEENFFENSLLSADFQAPPAKMPKLNFPLNGNGLDFSGLNLLMPQIPTTTNANVQQMLLNVLMMNPSLFSTITGVASQQRMSSTAANVPLASSVASAAFSGASTTAATTQPVRTSTPSTIPAATLDEKKARLNGIFKRITEKATADAEKVEAVSPSTTSEASTCNGSLTSASLPSPEYPSRKRLREISTQTCNPFQEGDREDSPSDVEAYLSKCLAAPGCVCRVLRTCCCDPDMVCKRRRKSCSPKRTSPSLEDAEMEPKRSSAEPDDEETNFEVSSDCDSVQASED